MRARARVGLAAAVAFAAATAAFALDPDLAKRAVSEKESERWDACELLAKDGSPEAMKLFLGILRADPDHETRDHAIWSGRNLASDEAVDRVAAAAGGNASPLVRRSVAAAIARSKRPRALEILAKTVKNDPDVSVRCEALDGMWWFPDDPRAVEVCKASARTSDPRVRAAAVDAAGRLTAGAGRDVVLGAWADSDEGVKCAALAAMAADDALAHLAEAAASKDWRLRAQAVDTSVRFQRAPCVELLIGLLGDKSLRVGGAAVRALRFLSGKDIAPDAELWRAWWAANQATWKAPGGRPNDAAEPPPDPKATRARFQGLEIETDRAAFVIDGSTSMTRKMKSGVSRADTVRDELRRTLGALPDGFRANLILFGIDVHACFDAARPLTPKVRESILEFAASTELETETNLAGGLLLALADDSIDTIYMLTDGVPSAGDFVSDYRVRQAVLRANRTRKVAIHTIGFGVTKDDDRKFLADLANDHGGRCVFR